MSGADTVPALGEMVGDKREVGEAGSGQRRGREVEPEHPRQACGGDLGGAGRQVLRPRVEHPRDGQQRQHDHGRDGQGREGDLVVMPGHREYQGHQQRAEHGPELVERFMDPERPPVPDLLGGVREHGVPRRVPGRLPDPFQDDQQGGHLPVACQGEQRHDRHLQHVAADRDRPVPSGAVRAAPGKQPQAVPEEFPGPADDADRERPGAEQPEIRAGDAPRALVGEVGEEAHDPDHHHELHRRRRPGDPLPDRHRHVRETALTATPGLLGTIRPPGSWPGTVSELMTEPAIPG